MRLSRRTPRSRRSRTRVSRPVVSAWLRTSLWALRKTQTWLWIARSMLPKPCCYMRKADNDCIAPSLACIRRRASSSVQASTRSFSVSNQACNCTSLESAMLCATRNCSPVEDTIEYGYQPNKAIKFNITSEEIEHDSSFSSTQSIVPT